jgi:hypothetical protein
MNDPPMDRSTLTDKNGDVRCCMCERIMYRLRKNPEGGFPQLVMRGTDKKPVFSIKPISLQVGDVRAVLCDLKCTSSWFRALPAETPPWRTIKVGHVQATITTRSAAVAWIRSLPKEVLLSGGYPLW